MIIIFFYLPLSPSYPSSVMLPEMASLESTVWLCLFLAETRQWNSRVPGSELASKTRPSLASISLCWAFPRSGRLASHPPGTLCFFENLTSTSPLGNDSHYSKYLSPSSLLFSGLHTHASVFTQPTVTVDCRVALGLLVGLGLWQ